MTELKSLDWSSGCLNQIKSLSHTPAVFTLHPSTVAPCCNLLSIFRIPGQVEHIQNKQRTQQQILPHSGAHSPAGELDSSLEHSVIHSRPKETGKETTMAYTIHI